jgi:hypothetical protein
VASGRDALERLKIGHAHRQCAAFLAIFEDGLLGGSRVKAIRHGFHAFSGLAKLCTRTPRSSRRGCAESVLPSVDEPGRVDYAFFSRDPQRALYVDSGRSEARNTGHRPTACHAIRRIRVMLAQSHAKPIRRDGRRASTSNCMTPARTSPAPRGGRASRWIVTSITAATAESWLAHVAGATLSPAANPQI